MPHIQLKPDKALITLLVASSLSIMLFIAGWLLPEKQLSDSAVLNGVLDIAGNDIDIISLSGQWKFAANEITHEVETFSESAQVPERWSGSDRFGSNSYLLDIRGLISGSEYYLRIPYMGTAYSLFWNGKIIAQNGQVGMSRQETVPEYMPLIVSQEASDIKNELILQVSNYHHRRGGSFQPIFLGGKDEIEQLDFWRLFSDWAFVILFITMGISQFIYYLSNRNKAYLFLSLLFLTVGLNAFLGTSEVLLLRCFPGISWFIYEKICYLLSYTIPIWAMLFANKVYPRIPRKRCNTLLLPFIFIILFIMASPSYIYTIGNPFYQIYGFLIFGIIAGIIFIALMNKEPGALLIFLSTIVILGIVFSSMLYSNSKIFSGTYLPLSFLKVFEKHPEFTRLPLIELVSYLLIFLINNILGYYHFFQPKNRAESEHENSEEEQIELRIKQMGLSAREQQIVKLIVQGKSNLEIGEILFVSTNTVKTHISHIYKKSNVNKRTLLINKVLLP